MALYGDEPKKGKTQKMTLQKTKVDKPGSTPTGRAFNNELDKIKSLSVKKTSTPMMQKLARDVQYKPSGTVPKITVNSAILKALQSKDVKKI